MTSRKSTRSASASAKRRPNRRALVVASLLGVMVLTSGLLLAMHSNPLRPDSLYAVEAVDSLDIIFNTETPAGANRWKYIYIHQSATPSGSVETLARPDGSLGDHFVIGNGDGAEDGELLIDPHWVQQEPAAGPQGIKLDPGCISICLVGNLDQTAPTSTQYRRLFQLVQTLQGRYHIPSGEVSWITTLPEQPGGIGHWFPAKHFHEQLLSATPLSR